MRMIENVLDNNVFDFNGKEYIQTEGLAIGSRLGKNFACAYMRRWDAELKNSEKRPILYKRFIDDGFGIWTRSVGDLIRFQEYAKSIHNGIKVNLAKME